MLAHADETDDSHGPSRSHPGCAAVPATLALGEQNAIDGVQVVRAFALGYDVGTRVTMSLGGPAYQTLTHRSTHGTAGIFCAAAAAGCVSMRMASDEVRTVSNRDLPDICLQHMVGVMLVDRTVSFAASHDKARMKDPAVLRQRVKVELLADPRIDSRRPRREGIVELTLPDGTQLSEWVRKYRRDEPTQDVAPDKLAPSSPLLDPDHPEQWRLPHAGARAGRRRRRGAMTWREPRRGGLGGRCAGTTACR